MDDLINTLHSNLEHAENDKIPDMLFPNELQCDC